jgi:UPF0755 protein
MIRNRFFNTLIVSVLALAVVIGVGWGTLRHTASLNGTTTVPEYLYVEPGDGVLRIAYKARRLGLIRRSWHMTAAARLAGYDSRLRAGEYEVLPGQSIIQILQKLIEGDVHYRRIILPEGKSAAEFGELIKSHDAIDLSGFKFPEEGSLLPDTYFYQRGETAAALIARMQSSMDVLVQEAWQNRAEGLPFSTIQEAIILASIVEKETALARERALVAAVFTNRLKKKMRLQSDPTVVYGIAYGFPIGRALTRADLNEKTDYNTYKISGLPPKPIANPGRESILAVLNPADVDFLYFVADGTGGHAFSRTLREHNRNVAIWRKFRDSQNQ